MIEFSNGGCLVETLEELPNLASVTDLFADFETTSGDERKDSLDPWHDCDVAGIAVTIDDIPRAWYVPVNHHSYMNLDRGRVTSWLRNIMTNADRWINHNVKYDAHVSVNALSLRPCVELVDTLTLAKIIDSDRQTKGGYSLDALSRDWLKEDIKKYHAAMKPYLHNNKDYGRVPPDVMAEYACQDVLTARRLWKYVSSRCPDQCARVWNTEIELTSVLFDVEQHGLCVEPVELQTSELLTLNRMSMIDVELETLTGRSFRPHVNADCYDVFCNQYDLPVMGTTDTGNPSFDKKALMQYAAYPYAPKEVVKLVQEYRHLNTLNNTFIRPYQTHHVDGRMHPQYNQVVRTGRMSCRRPNAQQLSPDAKKLIHPSSDHAFLSIDYSQIEFRIIVHYIKDTDCIKAYAHDPDTDFHQWVADMIPMSRHPAKNVNFMMGYGGGRALCVSMLSTNMEVVGDLKQQVDELLQDEKIRDDQQEITFNMLCRKKAEHLYNKYHMTLPGLKRTAYRASLALKKKGYVYNLYGRHRHLPSDAAHKAFNTLCQSSAADLMKERTVAVARVCKSAGINIVASVHDETLFEGPVEMIEDRVVQCGLALLSERPSAQLRVPIRVAVGTSRLDWLSASKQAEGLVYSPADRLNAQRWLETHGSDIS
jgi:DNA polymerase-1